MVNYYAYIEPPSGGVVRVLKGNEVISVLDVSGELPEALESLVGVLVIEAHPKILAGSNDRAGYVFYHIHSKAGQCGEWFTYRGIKRVFPNIDEILLKVKAMELIRHD